MIAIQSNDVCYSTAYDGLNPFNTDGQKRTELPVELARSALDFDIVKSPSFDGEGRQIPGHFHLRKSTDNSFIPSIGIGNQYTPIQHRDVFDYIVNKVMPCVPEMKLEMAGTIHGGGIGLIAAKYGDTFAIPGDESPNEMRLFFNNPCNGSGRMTLGFTTVRVVCQNTLIAATREAGINGWKISHTFSGPAFTMQAVASIKAQAVAALEIKRRSEELAKIGVNGAIVEAALDAVYPIKNLPEGHARSLLEHVREGVVKQFECGETAQTFTKDNAWKLLNAFTYPIFNPNPLKLAKSKSKDLAEIQYKGMTGSVGQRVTKIFNKVERVAYAA